jgi:conjugative transfer signal peptidase TraF
MASVLAFNLLAVMCPKTDTPPLLWNLSPSVPIGLYGLIARPPGEGALAVIRLAEPLRTLADIRGYLPAGALLIKRVAATAGDMVCRHGPVVTINGRPVAGAKAADGTGQPLPRWSGCRRLKASQVFVLSPAPDSFDSRYLGPVDRRHVLGTAVPVWLGETSSRLPTRDRR